MPGRLAACQSCAAVVTVPRKLGPPCLAAVLLLGACATAPTGPTVPALPGSGKSLEQFRSDDAACQQYALAQVTGTAPDRAATGGMQDSAYDMQRRYDLGYIQCMYFKGHRVPVLGPTIEQVAQPSGSAPPPPPGTPPPAAR